MSQAHPIIAITGSSGSGSSQVVSAFEHICRRENARMALVDGDGFHRYDRMRFTQVVAEAHRKGETISHFAPASNLFQELQALLTEYSESGSGKRRFYFHDEVDSVKYGQAAGTFSPWEVIPPDTDVMIYQGLHGCYVDDDVDIAQYIDLKIGVVPVVNLEWIQKAHRDIKHRGYHPEQVTRAILRRLPDYVKHITPQFSRTDINFQRVPMVDTSNPFIALDVPLQKETAVVIRVAQPERVRVDFRYLLNMIPKSFMSRSNSIVVPGDEMGYAMELIFSPVVHELLEKRSAALAG